VTNVVNLMPINLFTDYAIWTLSQFRMTSGGVLTWRRLVYLRRLNARGE